MKIVNIIGGLGNQMFQYAFAYALHMRNPEEQVLIDTSLFHGYSLHNGFEIERLFGLRLPIARKKDLRRVIHYIPYYPLSRLARKILPSPKSLYLDPNYLSFDSVAMMQHGDKYYDGYWQTEKYFGDIRDTILDLFSFKTELRPSSRDMAEQILTTNSVAIHVRRGDYTKSPNYKGICDLDYYERAINKAKELITNPRFFIFSDDLPWCRIHLPPLIGAAEVVYVEGNVGINCSDDMRLMSFARCNVLANSSFSWWAAYLNQRCGRFAIAPSKWVNEVESKDVYLDSWIKV